MLQFQKLHCLPTQFLPPIILRQQTHSLCSWVSHWFLCWPKLCMPKMLQGLQELLWPIRIPVSDLLPQLPPWLRKMHILLQCYEICRPQKWTLWVVPPLLPGMLGPNQASVPVMSSQQLHLQSPMLPQLMPWSNFPLYSFSKVVWTLPIWMPILFFITVLLLLHSRLPLLSRLVLPKLSWKLAAHPPKILPAAPRYNMWGMFQPIQFQLSSLQYIFMPKMSGKSVFNAEQFSNCVSACQWSPDQRYWAVFRNLSLGHLWKSW